jgi:hypothetical protein
LTSRWGAEGEAPAESKKPINHSLPRATHISSVRAASPLARLGLPF